MRNLLRTLRLFIWFVILLGLIYPLLITGIAQLTMPHKANGSLVKNSDHQTLGSLLIGQNFASERYFWPRPSAIHYQPLPSEGSNLAPTSRELKKEVEERVRRFEKPQSEIPSDLLFASASGLDPHISPEAALFQVERIAAARNMEKATLEALIEAVKEEREFGFLGTPRLNLLLLNLKLDEIDDKRRH
jgi:potassium-transporting ATPase KdpC subunit